MFLSPRRALLDQRDLSVPSAPSDPEQSLRSVRILKLDQSNQSNFSENCSICWQELRPEGLIENPVDIVKIEPCEHQYHRECLEPWVAQDLTRPTCPNCRVLLDGLEVAVKQESVEEPPVVQSCNFLWIITGEILFTAGLISERESLALIGSAIMIWKFGEAIRKCSQDGREEIIRLPVDDQSNLYGTFNV